MKYITILFLLFTTQFGFSQSKSLTKIVDQIDFQSDTIKSVFDWVADNIKYDLAKLRDLKKGVNFYKNGKFKNIEEYKADQLNKVIKRKRGVCDDYTLLFNSIVSELGYTSYIVEGVTKGPNGKINKDIGHSWNAVKVNGSWKLYDPTWGAGYVKEDKKFVKKYLEQWYDVDPENMKERHFPFDPIWQLSANPMSYKEFEKGVQSGESESINDYEEMITTHLSLGDKERMTNELNRLEASGGKIRPIKNREKFLNSKISVSDIPSILESCKASTQMFNEYMNEGKAKRFSGDKWTLEYSKSALLEIKDQLEQSIVAFDNVKVKNSKSKRAFKKNITMSEKIIKHVDKELEFLDSKL